jgi:glycosyltransferase involved in cell wall biosynthesis
LGRLIPAKGLHVLAEALALIPRASIQLDAFALLDGDSDKYLDRLRRALSQDRRIRLLPPVAPDEVGRTLADYDVVAVPSQGFETGPLVVLEAFASRLPVIGSALGGISELISHGETGLLVEAQAADAWASAISRICQDRDLLQRMAENIAPPRTMHDVAGEMAHLYRRSLAEEPLSASGGGLGKVR